MARLTESYLRNMIKKTMNEMLDGDYYSKAVQPSYEDYMPTYDAHDLAIKLYKKLKNEGANPQTIQMADELVNALYHMNVTADNRSQSITDTAEKTGYPERYSPGSHVSPTMDESRRNKSTPRRK
jgi:hypothetical protein